MFGFDRLIKGRYRKVYAEVIGAIHQAKKDVLIHHLDRVSKLGNAPYSEYKERVYNNQTVTIEEVICPVTVRCGYGDGALVYHLEITQKIDAPLFHATPEKRAKLAARINFWFAEFMVEEFPDCVPRVMEINRRHTTFAIKGTIKLE